MSKFRYAIMAEAIRCKDGQLRTIKSLHGLTAKKLAEITGINCLNPQWWKRWGIRVKAARGRFYCTKRAGE